MQIGDYVTRNKYHNDIVFRIVRFRGSIVDLCGVSTRLIADSEIGDLAPASNIREEKEEVEWEEARSDQGLVRGKVLHLDGDKVYLERCLKIYEKYGIEVTGYHMEETEMPKNVTNLLVRHKPDILVITGHDSYREEPNQPGYYQNSDNFVQTVKHARICMPDKDSLVIFAGACQSDYQNLIRNGANFASSIRHQNIHVLDPVYIAIQIATSHVGEFVNVSNILKHTVSKGRGLGGVDTRGVARRVYGEEIPY